MSRSLQTLGLLFGVLAGQPRRQPDWLVLHTFANLHQALHLTSCYAEHIWFSKLRVHPWDLSLIFHPPNSYSLSHQIGQYVGQATRGEIDTGTVKGIISQKFTW